MRIAHFTNGTKSILCALWRNSFSSKNEKKEATWEIKTSELFSISFLQSAAQILFCCVQIKTCNSLNKLLLLLLTKWSSSCRLARLVCIANVCMARGNECFCVCIYASKASKSFQYIFFHRLLCLRLVHSLFFSLIVFAHFWINNSLGN